ncbi:type II toxin-antitoxin system VapC family toxin [Ottowia sp.]|uniref:type II toxin-antitoxin system VapC family toxin n=1 Tax=Ottowia sp. TaxID=1898956 RepID=UPI002CED7B46|nr:PIN domain-containing protein [Ottowia sp.]
MHVLLDTGPWVALLCRDDNHHVWARAQWAMLNEPVLTCEAVAAETCFLLARHGFDPVAALKMLERGVVRLAFDLQEHTASVRALFERYDNVPASLADACLLRMSELHEPCKVFTLDRDFQIYRRHGRRTVPVISPWA